MVAKGNDQIEGLVSKLAHITATAATATATTAIDTTLKSKTHSEAIDTTPAKNVVPPSPFASSRENVCSASAGARILFATDEWFAAADNLLRDDPPFFDPDAYCEQGKVMDGWESRRRREPGHDWCLIALSERATIAAVEVDTAHFTGNNVPAISIQIADLNAQQSTVLVSQLPGSLERLLHGGQQGVGHTPQEVSQAEEATKAMDWQELLSKSPLRPGYEASRMHYFELPEPRTGTVVRVNYFPDGGVARMKLWAINDDTTGVHRERKPQYLPITTGKICTVIPHSTTDVPPSRQEFEFLELSGHKFGGQGLACSNKHYGEPWQLIQDTLGKDMGDGWETARHPDRPSVLHKDASTGLIDSPLMDWAILKLGKVTDGVERVILDTKHFRGNYPESVLVEGCFAERGMTDGNVGDLGHWFPLLNRTRMSPDAEHVFDKDLDQIENATRPVSHVRVSIYPDGGLSRVRIYGKTLDGSDDAMRSNL